MKTVKTFDKKLRRRKKTRGKISGNSSKPRISIFRSSCNIYTQAVDDQKKITLAAFSSLNLKTEQEKKKTPKSQQSKSVGLKLAQKLIKAGIKEAVFDRSSYAYHGRVAAVADGLREGGIKI